MLGDIMSSSKMTVVEIIKVKEEMIVQAIEEITKLICEGRKEEGCLDYSLHCHEQQSETLLLTCDWESKDAWQKHMSSGKIEEYQISLKSLIESITLYEFKKL